MHFTVDVRRPLALWLAFGAAMCLVPLAAGPGTVRILIFANYIAIFAMSWDVVAGLPWPQIRNSASRSEVFPELLLPVTTFSRSRPVT